MVGKQNQKLQSSYKDSVFQKNCTQERWLNLTGSDKVKVLLAQALFGKPDVLLLDEPTNHLDIKAIQWLEEFLINFENTVIVVSHDRHFLNKVCTHIADLDFGKIQLYVGNYDFWYESSQLAQKLTVNPTRKKKKKSRNFKPSLHVSVRMHLNQNKQPHVRKCLKKLHLTILRPSSRRYPFVHFKPDREIGNDVLRVEGLSKTIDGEKVLNNISFTMNKDDKIALLGANDNAKTALVQNP